MLRMPESARLCSHPDKKCWVLTARKLQSLPEKDFEVLPIGCDDGNRVPLDQALAVLRKRGIQSLMVEGGATVITAFLEAGLVDAVIMTIAPTIVGGYKAVNQLDTETNGQIPIVNPMYSGMLGKDIMAWGDIVFEGSRA